MEGKGDGNTTAKEDTSEDVCIPGVNNESVETADSNEAVPQNVADDNHEDGVNCNASAVKQETSAEVNGNASTVKQETSAEVNAVSPEVMQQLKADCNAYPQHCRLQVVQMQKQLHLMKSVIVEGVTVLDITSNNELQQAMSKATNVIANLTPNPKIGETKGKQEPLPDTADEKKKWRKKKKPTEYV